MALKLLELVWFGTDNTNIRQPKMSYSIGGGGGEWRGGIWGGGGQLYVSY